MGEGHRVGEGHSYRRQTCLTARQYLPLILLKTSNWQKSLYFSLMTLYILSYISFLRACLISFAWLAAPGQQAENSFFLFSNFFVSNNIDSAFTMTVTVIKIRVQGWIWRDQSSLGDKNASGPGLSENYEQNALRAQRKEELYGWFWKDSLGGMMVNFICHCKWAMGSPDSVLFLGVWGAPGEKNIWFGGSCGWALANFWGLKRTKGRGKWNLPPLFSLLIAWTGGSHLLFLCPWVGIHLTSSLVLRPLDLAWIASLGVRFAESRLWNCSRNCMSQFLIISFHIL